MTTLEEEAARIDAMLATGRVAVDVVGASVQGRPIRLLRIGDPPPPADRRTILYVGSQHGDEIAGREAMLDWAEHLSTTVDATELGFLQSHGVMIIPTPNPDGTAADQRRNANNVDINRTHTRLDQPESRAIATVLGRARPLIVVDHHEDQSNPTPDVRYRGPVNVQTYQGIIDTSADLIDAIKARIIADGYNPGDYPQRPHEERLLGCSGLRGSVAVLIETDRFGQDLSDRRAQHFATAQETLAYASANIGDLEQLVVDAAVWAAAQGEAGTAPFQMYNGTNHGEQEVILDPPPLGYRLTGLAPAFHLQVFNIAMTGSGVVEMGQFAQPIIPYLFDAQAEYGASLGIRLFSLDSQIVVPTVRELAPIVSASHRVRIEARVVTGLPTGLDPDGVEIPVLGGSVTWDGTADILGSVELVTVARWPRARERLLLPAGNEIFLRYGVDVGGSIGTLWTPLGYFRINRPSQDDVARGPITLSGEDRMCRILDARLLRPRQLSVGRTLGDIFAELVLEAMPEATIIFDDDTEYATIARTLTTEESRYKVLRELADVAGKMLYWDGEGILRIVSPPDPAEPVWHLRAGPGGALISASREISREQVYNAVVARGEGSEMADPVEAVAYDDDPDSMTYFFGPFGMVPRFYASPVISTEDQAYSAAVSMLRRSLGLPYEVAGEIAPNPALRPGDPVRFTWDDGNREVHVWETLELPLDGESPMSGTTQQQTLGRVGRM